MEAVQYVVTIVVGYLLGAIPSGLVIGKLLKGVDLRDFGSGKTGATNALRTLGKGAAAVVLLADLFKSIAAVVVAYLIVGTVAAECLAGFAAVIGHNWPVYAGFRGGRGVVVSYAVFWILCWPAALISSAIGLTIIAVGRMVSLGVLIGAVVGLLATVPFVLHGTYSPWVLVYAVLGASLIVMRHLDNIERLRTGTERKIGQPATPAT